MNLRFRSPEQRGSCWIEIGGELSYISNVHVLADILKYHRRHSLAEKAFEFHRHNLVRSLGYIISRREGEMKVYGLLITKEDGRIKIDAVDIEKWVKPPR
jgi:hypothetical protein